MERRECRMRAIIYHERGGPDVLAYEEVPIPRPNAGEVLVRVRACGVNPGDGQIRSGLAGDRFPLPYIPGWDISGTVTELGEGVTGFRPGDEVYGMTANSGGCAEFAVIPSAQLARKPVSLTHIQAAGVPMSGFAAWVGLFRRGRLAPGETVLVNGASGGVGHFAVQLAKLEGARVIAVASGRNESWVRELGADAFVDYTSASPDLTSWQADLVLDTVGGADGSSLLGALKLGGRLVPVAYGTYSAERAAELGVTVGEVPFETIGTRDLEQLGRLFDEGRLRVFLDSVTPLRDARLAFERSESRRARGKIVVSVAEN